MMKRVPVNQLIPFSAVDGPGNRTAIFLQGCNFNCRYCHNPETRALCTHCGECVAGCPAGALSLQRLPGQEAPRVLYEPARCIRCDACIKTCKHDASPRIRWMSAEEAYAEVGKAVPFIRGVTVSGGECTLYPAFLRELGELCKRDGLGFLLDSNGSYDFQTDPESLLPAIDGVMLDIKAWNPEEHRGVTDCGNAQVLKNMQYLAECGKLYEIRTVISPGLFDAEETVRECARALYPYLSGQNRIRYKLIAYRPMGVRQEYKELKSPNTEYLSRLAMIAREEGMEDIVLI